MVGTKLVQDYSLLEIGGKHLYRLNTCFVYYAGQRSAMNIAHTKIRGRTGNNNKKAHSVN